MRKGASSWLFVAVVAGGVALSPRLAAGPAPSGESQFKSGIELVALNVVVTDSSRRLVTNLRQGDFVVLEDGVPQPISFFASGQVPLDLVLLIDASSSMGSLRATAQQAAGGFLGVLGPGDRGAVLGFNERLTVLQDFSSDTDALRGAVRRAGASGNTALYSAIYVALRQFGLPARQTDEVRRQAIVVLTDGGENTSPLGFEALEEEARVRGVAIYAIMLQSASLRERERLEGRLSPTRQAVRELAVETGAQAYFPTLASELASVYGSIAAELTNQYSIAYQPQGTVRGSALRRVAVQIGTHPALRARARTNYLPRAAVPQFAGMR